MRDGDALAQKLLTILPYLNEKQRRLVLGAEARSLGCGGVSQVARATGISRPTIHQGLRELDADEEPKPGVRRAGGASFAVASLRRWWQVIGYPTYPQAKQLLISADSGGSNGYRLRLWKLELQHFADETQLEGTVCHLPPGTS